MMLTIDGKHFDETQCEVFLGARGMKLYRTAKGNFIMVHTARKTDNGYKAVVIERQEALKWLVSRGHTKRALELDPELFKGQEEL